MEEQKKKHKEELHCTNYKERTMYVVKQISNEEYLKKFIPVLIFSINEKKESVNSPFLIQETFSELPKQLFIFFR